MHCAIVQRGKALVLFFVFFFFSLLAYQVRLLIWHWPSAQLSYMSKLYNSPCNLCNLCVHLLCFAHYIHILNETSYLTAHTNCMVCISRVASDQCDHSLTSTIQHVHFLVIDIYLCNDLLMYFTRRQYVNRMN